MSQASSPTIAMRRGHQYGPIAYLNTMLTERLQRGFEVATPLFSSFLRSCVAGPDDHSPNASRKSSVARTAGLIDVSSDAQLFAAAEGLVPVPVIEKMAAFRKVQKQRLFAIKRFNAAQGPAAELSMRIEQTMQAVRERMDFNRDYEKSDEEWHSLGQRVEDLSHCLSTIQRRAQTDLEELENLDEEERLCGEALVDAIEDWFTEARDIAKDPMEIDEPEYEAPFDMKIIKDAEEICHEQMTADEKELEELKGLPFQPEGRLVGRRSIKRITCDHIDEAKEAIEVCERQVQKLHEDRAAPQRGCDEGDFRQFDDDDSDLDTAIAKAEDNLAAWREDLEYAVQWGRALDVDVTSNGSITGDRGYDTKATGGTALIQLWGVDEIDDEREATPEELEQLIAKAKEKLEDWHTATEFSVQPETTPATPRPASPTVGTSDEDVAAAFAAAVREDDDWVPDEFKPNLLFDLETPQESDSISQCDEYGVRKELGYSLYGQELGQLSELRQKARAELAKQQAELIMSSTASSADAVSEESCSSPTLLAYRQEPAMGLKRKRDQRVESDAVPADLD